MCVQVKCPSCGKPTWKGCGAHVEQVLGHVPKDQRCQCAASQAKPEPSGGLFGLFGGKR